MVVRVKLFFGSLSLSCLTSMMARKSVSGAKARLVTAVSGGT